MSKIRPVNSPSAHRDAVEGRLALRLAASLDTAARELPHDVSERLRIARQRALEHAQGVQTVSASVPRLAAAGRGRVDLEPPSWWLRLASLMPLIVLVAGFALIQHLHTRQQISAAAEIDAALLVDDLPPAAYGDPGFAAYLRNADVH